MSSQDFLPVQRCERCDNPTGRCEEDILQLQKMPPNAALYIYDYRLKDHFEVCEFILSPNLDKVFID